MRTPCPGWAVYLRTSSDENQKPELSRARQRFVIEENVLKRSSLPVIAEYVDVLTGKTPYRAGYQQLLADARQGRFSHVIVERADRFGRNDTEALRAMDELHEFGVAVRFANSPDLDPMDPDDRVLVTLSFTLARRESSLLGIRVRGGLRAKRQAGGYLSQAPDGYRNVSGVNDGTRKQDFGRVSHWIEIDPERAALWRDAWAMLLTDEMTLGQIAEALHDKGYRHRSGRPFVEVSPDGKRKPLVNGLSYAFHCWTYAGWIVSERDGILPRTLRGDWEPIVSTEDFERGLDILSRRLKCKQVRRKQTYLLTGLIYYQDEDGHTLRLTGSTSNAGRAGGGTPYYRDARKGGVSFLCAPVDAQVAAFLHHITLDPDLVPAIREAYTYELSCQFFGVSRNEHKSDLQAALKRIDEEEARIVRLLAAGQISETVWQSLWAEWQDRRNEINAAMHQVELSSDAVIEDLDHALEIFSELGTLYNGLGLAEQKEVLRQMVERIVINNEGKLRVELRSPFAYLHQLSEDMTGLVAEWSGMERKTLQRKLALVNAPDRGKRSKNLQPPQLGELVQPLLRRLNKLLDRRLVVRFFTTLQALVVHRHSRCGLLPSGLGELHSSQPIRKRQQ